MKQFLNQLVLIHSPGNITLQENKFKIKNLNTMPSSEIKQQGGDTMDLKMKL